VKRAGRFARGSSGTAHETPAHHYRFSLAHSLVFGNSGITLPESRPKQQKPKNLNNET
jgi:hypothetical protein